MTTTTRNLQDDTAMQIRRARTIMRSLGLRIAARYLQRRGWCFEAVHFVLLGKEPRK